MALAERRDLLIVYELAAVGLLKLFSCGLRLGGQPVRPHPLGLDGEKAFQRLLLRVLGPGGQAVYKALKRFVHAVINHFPAASAISWPLLEHFGKRDADARRIEPQHTLADDDRQRNARPFAPVVDQLAGLPIGNDVMLDGRHVEVPGDLYS